jgi:hypothetical protein
MRLAELGIALNHPNPDGGSSTIGYPLGAVAPVSWQSLKRLAAHWLPLQPSRVYFSDPYPHTGRVGKPR